jgi:Cu(I)/Ag(I) efflux system membrane protein CusA/SilA
VVGGIVVMRYGENADKVRCSKAKMKEVEKDCLKGDLQNVHDRSELIKAIESVKGTLIEEMIAVSIVILFFSIEKCLNYSNTVANICCYRFHFASGFWISSNIMSLTGIALAIVL